MIVTVKIPKAKNYGFDHYHECTECESHSEPESCVEDAIDCDSDGLECYSCDD